MSWDNYKGLMESPLPTGLPTPDKTAIKSSVEGAKLSGEQLLEKISDPTAINYEKSGEFLKRYGREGEKIFKNMSTAGRKTGIPEAMELKKQKDLFIGMRRRIASGRLIGFRGLFMASSNYL